LVDELRFPLPANYVLGIDQTKAELERGKACYLRGQWKHGGWWYYYLYALGIKEPLGIWTLALLTICARRFCRGYRAPWEDELMLALPAAAILVLLSSQTGFATLRYLLPAFPFAFIWLGQFARSVSFKHWWLAGLGAAAVIWSVASSLSVYPHCLAYFNELVGGPTGGHAHLVDSNIDWGQDLLYLKRWLDEHPRARPLRLAYSGIVDPRLAGIEFRLPPKSPDSSAETASPPTLSPGGYAVSVNVMRGLPAPIPNGDGGWQQTRSGDYSYFLEMEPAAVAGQTIYIFDIPSP
jgi:hypothetical protein